MYIKEKLELNYDFVPNADKFQILSVVLMNLSVNSKKSHQSFVLNSFFFFSKILLKFPQILQKIITFSIENFDHDKIQKLSIVSKITKYKPTAE